MFEDLEVNPTVIGVAGVSGLGVLLIMNGASVGLLWKILGFFAGCAIGYVIGMKNFS